MAARIETEREATQTNTYTATTRTRNDAPPTTGGSENRQVSLTAFRVMFPGIVSGGKRVGD
jgi:hypothetical protein